MSGTPTLTTEDSNTIAFAVRQLLSIAGVNERNRGVQQPLIGQVEADRHKLSAHIQEKGDLSAIRKLEEIGHFDPKELAKAAGVTLRYWSAEEVVIEDPQLSAFFSVKPRRRGQGSAITR